MGPEAGCDTEGPVQEVVMLTWWWRGVMMRMFRMEEEDVA